MDEGPDFSLPRHQWKKFRCTGPFSGQEYDLWFWACLDCHESRPIQENPDEPEPERSACLGPGPHNPRHIAMIRDIFPRLGWKVAEHLREG